MFKRFLCYIVGFLVLYWVVDQIIRIRMTADLIEVPTELSTFFVKDLPNKTEAAELLARTRKNLMIVINHLQEMPECEIPPVLVPGIKRLVRKHCHYLELTELDAKKHGQVAMNQHKGQNIYLCLRECPDCLGLTQDARLLIVALHELAHSCTKNYDPLENGSTNHGEKFKIYESYIISIAENLGLLDPSAVIGSDYCGVRIPPVKRFNVTASKKI